MKKYTGITLRRAFLGMGIYGLLMMATAYFMQYQMELDPCPLCILQRIALLLAIPPLLVGAWCTSRRATAACAGAAITAALAGAALAVRHLWLQQLPADQVPECGPGLDYLLQTLPLGAVLMQMLGNSGECAEVAWSLFSISIPGWTLIGFSILAAGSGALLWASLRQSTAGARV